jgi:hypothetical protein
MPPEHPLLDDPGDNAQLLGDLRAALAAPVAEGVAAAHLDRLLQVAASLRRTIPAAS